MKKKDENIAVDAVCVSNSIRINNNYSAIYNI